MRELESLDESLLLKVGQLSLLGQFRRRRQLTEGFPKALEALPPTYVGNLGHETTRTRRGSGGSNYFERLTDDIISSREDVPWRPKSASAFTRFSCLILARIFRIGRLITPQRAPTFLDRFCGCGGFTLGLQRAGFDCLAAIDFNREAVAQKRQSTPRQ